MIYVARVVYGSIFDRDIFPLYKYCNEEEKISMGLRNWKISGNLTVHFFFFFSASFYRENGNIFPETKTYFKMFLRTRYQLAPFTWFWNFIACRVFNLNVVSVSCIGERETNQKRINYYTCTKIYIFYLDTISVTLNIIVTLTAVLINSNFAATSRIRGSHRLTLVVILFISGTFWFH